MNQWNTLMLHFVSGSTRTPPYHCLQRCCYDHVSSMCCIIDHNLVFIELEYGGKTCIFTTIAFECWLIWLNIL
jgi:hypothetical protein